MYTDLSAQESMNLRYLGQEDTTETEQTTNSERLSLQKVEEENFSNVLSYLVQYYSIRGRPFPIPVSADFSTLMFAAEFAWLRSAIEERELLLQ